MVARALKILIVTPAKHGTRLGNRITASRWAGMFRRLGHRTTIATEYLGGEFDLLIALHARRSAKSVLRFQQSCPLGKIVVAMTGTDLNFDLGKSSLVDGVLEIADQVLLLEPSGAKRLARSVRKKSRLIIQSAIPLKILPRKLTRVFEVAILGHLRPVKDPFRLAMAVRRLPASSRVRVIHFGQALTAGMERRAVEEMERNPRYRWFGSVPHSVAHRRLARSRISVLTSKAEGGPAVFSESAVNDVPILSTRIDAAVGLLGSNYPGLFKYGDTQALTDMIHRAETNSKFYERLSAATRKIKPKFLPETELVSWRKLIADLCPS